MEILIATVTIHQLPQLARRDPESEFDLRTRPHGSALSPPSVPGQTTSHTRVAPPAPAASSAATQTSPSPKTCCQSTTAPRATPPAHRPAARVPFPRHPEQTVRRDAPPTSRFHRARPSARPHVTRGPTPP